jgi:AraC-like DNA-binding protein
MNTTINIDFLTAFIFIGVFQGLVLSVFFIFMPSPNKRANIYQGLLLLSLTLSIIEQLLNLTGYIVKVLPVTNSTESLNLIIGPFLYLFVKRSLDPVRSKKEWMHFIIFFLYFCYLWFDLIQSNEFKYNSYVNSFHPDWPILDVKLTISNDPLGIKKYLNLITAFYISFYIALSMRLLVKKANISGASIFNTDDEVIKLLRNMVLHLLAIVLIFSTVKLIYEGDVGDYFIGIYVSVFTLLTTWRVMSDSSYFDRTHSFMDISITKYSKSSLTEQKKVMILENILHELERNRYYTDNLASLSDLAKKLGESSHHVSQVINEKLNKNFFELLADYRVEEAKKILTSDKSNKITIEELSEMVGYNSKTAFNNAFKKISGKTPSEFRKSVSSR